MDIPELYLFSIISSGRDTALHTIFDAMPHAVFIVGRDRTIAYANRRFREWHGWYDDTVPSSCRRVFHPEGAGQPCPECPFDWTGTSGRPPEREVQCLHDGNAAYYRITSTPIYSQENEALFVVETMEDITARRIAESAIERYSFQLEEKVSRKIQDLRDKEKSLTVLVNTIHEIKSATGASESIDQILRGYTSLNAACAVFALIDKDDMYIADIHPRPLIDESVKLFGINLIGIHIHPKRYPDNPFARIARSGKPLFYREARGLEDFFRECRLSRDDSRYARAAKTLEGCSLIIFPLKTKKIVGGAIAVFAETSILEDNYEYYSFLANSAAVEISRQKSSENLIKSKVQYRNLVENSRDMIILCEKDGTMRYSNSTFFDRTGLTPHRVKGHNFFSLFGHRDRKRLAGIVETLFTKGSVPELVEMKMKSQAEALLWTEMTLSLQPETGTFQAVARDITSRKRMESLIGDLTEFQEKIIQNEHIGIITMDLSRRISSINRGATNITGFTNADRLYQPLSGLIASGESPVDFLAIEGGMVSNSHHVSREVTMHRKDGSTATVMYRESALKDDRNRPAALIAFFFDITEKAELEKKSQELNQSLHHAQLVTILSLAKLTEYRDIETGAHLEKIMGYTGILARELSTFDEFRDYVTEEYITDLVNSCPLHDIGKVAIPDSILHKPGRLTPEEYEIMKNHSAIGGSTIEEAERRVQGRSYLNLGKEIAYYHHERWDGQGYPSGMKGAEIPLSARIVALADVYDALTSKRPYKEAYPHDEAYRIIVDNSGRHFDAEVVRAFINRAGEFQEMKLNYTPDIPGGDRSD